MSWIPSTELLLLVVEVFMHQGTCSVRFWMTFQQQFLKYVRQWDPKEVIFMADWRDLILIATAAVSPNVGWGFQCRTSSTLWWYQITMQTWDDQ